MKHTFLFIVLIFATVTPAFADQRTKAVKEIIEDSISSYVGNCPCPYNTDHAGRKCGKRSAYSRPGGEAPLCFEGDVTEEMVSAKLRAEKK